MTVKGAPEAVSVSLNGLIYTPVSNANGRDILTFVVDDQGDGENAAERDTARIAITINAVNDAPEILAPETDETDEDTPLTFNQSNGNAIIIEDVDAEETPDAKLTVTLTATSAVTLGSTTGITITEGEDGSPLVTFTGRPDAVNNALDGLIYTPTKNFFGEGFLDIQVSDNGNTGPGAESDVAAITITINAVNDAPSIVSGNPPDAVEGQKYLFLVEAEDVEGDDYTFSLGNGAPGWLTIDQVGLLSGTPGENDVASSVTFRVVVQDVEDANSSSSMDYTIAVAPDAIAPEFIVSPEAQEITETGAAMVWTASEPASARVAVGTDTTRVPDLKVDGRVQLTGLTPATAYTAVVLIADRRGNTTVSRPIPFRTLAAPDTRAPVFTRQPAQSGRTDKSLTFTWEADEAARGILRLTRANGDSLIPNIADSSTVFRLQGELTIGNLNPATTYTGWLELVDAAGNRPGSPSTTNNPARVEGRTLAQRDSIPPVLTSRPVAQGITPNRATIQYTTNEPATTVVQYGASRALGSETSDNNPVLDHAITLTGLVPNQTYFYRVGGADREGNRMAFSPVDSFRTLVAPDSIGPVFINTPTVITTTNTTAIISWRTDEPASFSLKAVAEAGADTLNLSRGDFISERRSPWSIWSPALPIPSGFAPEITAETSAPSNAEPSEPERIPTSLPRRRSVR